MEYIARIMEAVSALEEFSVLPLPGGYLNQPITLMRDIQTVRAVMTERRRASLEEARQVREAMAHTSLPGVPLPPLPEELCKTIPS